MTAAAASVPRRRIQAPAVPTEPDYWLLGAALLLLGFGLMMVSSASLSIADKSFGAPFHYVWRHMLALGLGLGAGILCFRVPLETWERVGLKLFLVGIVLLVLVLIPGIGRTVNGATRWIPLGPLNLQPSELMKLFTVIFVSGYLVRRQQEVTNSFSGFLKPMLLVAVASAVMVAEPDFGTAAVLLATVLGLMFLGGALAWQFAALLGTVVGLLILLMITSPYRLQRLIAFTDPWADPYNKGFQLTNSLIAFGRGEWFGVGLGNGIQKQFYLPEAHTDFLLAVVGEEFGLVGTLAIVALFAFIVRRAFQIGIAAEAQDRRFGAYLCYGFGLWLALQAFINVGVNIGLLPTKGLTLPFMSTGSNSIIVACMVIAVLLRVDYEGRLSPPPDVSREGDPW
jgi:cell division protein FtsW